MIQSEVFEVVDQNGQVRARLGTTTDGAVALHLYDPTGQVIWEAPPRTKWLPLHDRTPE